MGGRSFDRSMKQFVILSKPTKLNTPLFLGVVSNPHKLASLNKEYGDKIDIYDVETNERIEFSKATEKFTGFDKMTGFGWFLWVTTMIWALFSIVKGVLGFEQFAVEYWIAYGCIWGAFFVGKAYGKYFGSR